jgi:hypothetical protein
MLDDLPAAAAPGSACLRGGLDERCHGLRDAVRENLDVTHRVVGGDPERQLECPS